MFQVNQWYNSDWVHKDFVRKCVCACVHACVCENECMSECVCVCTYERLTQYDR